MTPGNRPEEEAAAQLKNDVEAQGLLVDELHIDRGYIKSPRTPDGESFRDRKVAPTTSKSGTERWAQDRERFLLTGGAEKAKAKTKIKEVPTLAEFEPRFIEQYAIANRLKPSTVDTYRTRLRLQLLPTLGAVRLNAIDKSEEQRLKAALAELDPPGPHPPAHVLLASRDAGRAGEGDPRAGRAHRPEHDDALHAPFPRFAAGRDRPAGAARAGSQNSAIGVVRKSNRSELKVN